MYMQLQSYSQTTAASDWPCFFAPQVFLFSISLIIIKCVTEWFCSSSSGIHHHKGHEGNNDRFFQQLAAPYYIFSMQFYFYCTLVCIYMCVCIYIYIYKEICVGGSKAKTVLYFSYCTTRCELCYIIRLQNQIRVWQRTAGLSKGFSRPFQCWIRQ